MNKRQYKKHIQEYVKKKYNKTFGQFGNWILFQLSNTSSILYKRVVNIIADSLCHVEPPLSILSTDTEGKQLVYLDHDTAQAVLKTIYDEGEFLQYSPSELFGFDTKNKVRLK